MPHLCWPLLEFPVTILSLGSTGTVTSAERFLPSGQPSGVADIASFPGPAPILARQRDGRQSRQRLGMLGRPHVSDILNPQDRIGKLTLVIQ